MITLIIFVKVWTGFDNKNDNNTVRFIVTLLEFILVVKAAVVLLLVLIIVVLIIVVLVIVVLVIVVLVSVVLVVVVFVGI